MKPTSASSGPFSFHRPGTGGVFFGRTADFADHDDRFGFIIVQEQIEHVDELGALDRVAADADAVDWPRPSLVVWNTAS
jgi:hypothetical protein